MPDTVAVADLPPVNPHVSVLLLRDTKQAADGVARSLLTKPVLVYAAAVDLFSRLGTDDQLAQLHAAHKAFVEARK